MTALLLSPKENTQLYGHTDTLKRLQEAYDQQKLHHGHIILGAKGIGKATLAYHFIRHVLAQNSFEDARKISQGSHPNVLTVTRQFDEKKGKYNAEIKVDDIAPFFAFLQQTTINHQHRFVVIDEADRMNRSVQNRILKTLEEPPVQTTIFLLAENKQALLPTILSRCQIHTLSPLTFEETRQHLDHHHTIDANDVMIYAALAEGALGQGLNLAQTEAALLWREWGDLLLSGHQGKHSAVMAFTDTYGLAKNDAPYQLLKKFIPRLLVGLIRTKANTPKAEDTVLVQTLNPKLAEYFMALAPLALLNMHDSVVKAFRDEQNSYLDRKVILLSVVQEHLRTAKSVAA